MTDAPASTPESIGFRAEIRQLLNILVHSLYTDREIFLRELISNASDALNRYQFTALTQHDLRDAEAELAIRITGDTAAHTLTIADSGVGMTREELIENLGTIAHSGAATFLKSLEEGQKVADLIGQFGVGFYAVFMVADEVRVTSLSYRPEATAWTWIASGGENYTLEPAEKAERGTRIEIKLKDDAHDFAEAWRLREIIHKHSDFVSFPIYLGDEAQAVNRQTALWREPGSKITAEAAADFYKQLTLDFNPPLTYAHLNTDAPVQISALLFVPGSAERGMFSLRKDHGLKLYSRKVLIQEYAKDLLPNYLRFVEGVVESEDVPLSVSRETVQTTRVMERIKNALTHKLLDTLKELAVKDAETYAKFWKQFGPFIKEGMATDPTAREKLTPVLRFYSSRPGAGEALTSLAEYVGRMDATQRTIYYLLGDDLKSVAHSPHLDLFRQQNLEVLYLVDPLDSFMLTGLPTYEGYELKSADDPSLDLPRREASPEAEVVPDAEFDALTARFKEQLGDRIAGVRATDRLVDNALRLVAPDDAKGHEMDRVRRLLEKDFTVPPKMVELNRQHPLIRNLAGRLAANPADPLAGEVIEQLFESALLVEGLLPNPAAMVGRIQKLMEAATRAG
ncbi:MAG: molecular chaperone HtpG [Anaerolineales bacterium]|nr:molecular chaperone HtpG [Anaerolineales bacterium]